MAKGYRHIPDEDISRYWDLRAKGSSIKAAAEAIGVNYSTARNWEVKLDNAKAMLTRGVDVETAQLLAVPGSKHRRMRAIQGSGEPGAPMMRSGMRSEAKRGLDDFDYFRRRLLGRFRFVSIGLLVIHPAL